VSESPVLVDRQGDQLLITLNRPEVHNAYNAAMRDALVEVLAVGIADPDVSVRLGGKGPSFCSGGDLTEFGTTPDPTTAHLIRTTRSPGLLIAELASRCTVTVHGACVGAGIELAAFAGTVVTNGEPFFQLPEVGMGLVPGAGGTVSLPRRIGRQRTAELALTGRRLDLDTALRWGLVDRNP
jgi:enoyl-CoA hydratase/carnithine racemase